MIFEDRTEAGRRLASALGDVHEAVLFAIPRGGVPVAAEISELRRWPLDVVVPRKLGAPGNPELGIGAIAGGVRVLDRGMIARLGIAESYLDEEIARQESEIERRTASYRGERAPRPIENATVVVVDDGVATGGTAVAAIRWVRGRGAASVILAVPVAPADAVTMLSKEADRVVCLETPEPFRAVGAWYRRFPQLHDDDVIRSLEEHA